jgi:hypothetical protein
LNRYCELYDGAVIDIIMKKGGELSRDVFERLFHRKLFKLVYEKPVSELEGAIRKSRYTNLNDKDRLELEGHIAGKLKIRPEFVIVHSVSIKNPTYRSPVLSVDDQNILVDFSTKKKEPEHLQDIPEFILNLANPLKKTHYIQVYAPQDHLNDIIDDDKKKERERISREISEVVER